ncbi:stage III sporulation protein AB [Cohnella sp. OV330]|uniref:stage III sporulation protein SpoIIIAB n=1 Tax=Cohnella sp. OV330 TaxID=1855288 RepID=UPI0008E2DF31|nr:stage III sporulation protein SpoIIIAB [Cohnella sp. OV330]SFB20290.1 stage III sporulation protein AB [Cohnella sp. OV330]
MLKLAGAALILFAGTMIGFMQAAKFAQRPKQIRQLLHALQRLETEIGYGQTPLPGALARIAAALTAPVSALFAEASARLASGTGETVSDCWEQAFKAGWPATSMRPPERDTMLRLGETLGASGAEDQLKHLKLAMHQLQAEEQAARDDQQRYEKLCRSLGVLTAALVVILMM